MEGEKFSESMPEEQRFPTEQDEKGFDAVAELEKLVINYRNLHGLLETFADGVMAQLGDYDITKGIYAIAEALGEQNKQLRALLEQITGRTQP